MVVSGSKMTVDEVMLPILRDKPFYENSGGGITLTGGEPLLQSQFSAAILQRCQSEGIATAIETAGYALWSSFEKLLPYVDLVFYDLKLMDSNRHKEATGADNERILANAQRVGHEAKEVVIRVPVVPGINDDIEDLRAIAQFAATLPKVSALELMRFHALGASKAKSLGIDDWASGQVAPSNEQMDDFLEACRAEGIETRIG